MQCPVDQHSLTIHDSEGHAGYFCKKCKGIWLPKKYVAAIRYMRNFHYDSFVSELVESKISVSHLPCPLCRSSLSVSRKSEIEIDWCDCCGGIWLDSGELNKLLNALHKQDTGLTKGEMTALALPDLLQLVIAAFIS